MIYRVNEIYIKKFSNIFINIEKLILKFISQSTGLRIAKIILEKNKMRGIILSKGKTYYVITIVGECNTDGAMYPWTDGTEGRTQK